MELRNVYTFIRAAELKNFSKTADLLGYAQSTVTMQIHQLEEELGKPLFDRLGRTVSLTTFGEACLPLARKLYATAQEMQSLNLEPAELTGTLRIGVVESLFVSDFLQVISRYQSQYPNVLLDLHMASSLEICDLLSTNKLDIGYHLMDGNDFPDLLHLHQMHSEAVFVANQNHPLSAATTHSIQEILREYFVLTEEISVYHRALQKVLYAQNLKIKERIRLKSTRGIIDVLKYSGGISFLPRYSITEDVTQGFLKIIPCSIPSIPVTVTLSVHKEKWISPQMQGFIHLLKDSKL